MDLSGPYPSMFPTVDSAVLSVLSATTRPRTGREIARLADRSQSATQRVLDRLVEHGLVVHEDAGRSRIYTLNRLHLAATPIIELVNLRSRLIARLGETLELWQQPPLHASLFGSAARGDGDVGSDIDIFLVRPAGVAEDEPAWRGAVEELEAMVVEWTGNYAGIAEVAEQEVHRLRKDEPAVLSSLRKDSIDLFGEPARELIGRS